MGSNRCLNSTKSIFSNFFEGLGATSLIYLIGNAMSNLLVKFSFNEELSNSPFYARIIFLAGFTAVSGGLGYCAYMRNCQNETKLNEMREEIAGLRTELDAVMLRSTFRLDSGVYEAINDHGVQVVDRQALLNARETSSSP